MELSIPYDPDLAGRRMEHLSSLLGISSLDHYNEQTDLVLDQPVAGPDGKYFGTDHVMNHRIVHDISVSQKTNSDFHEKELRQYSENENPVQHAALPKWKSGFFMYP
jgi:hypothetical protein